MTPRIHTKDSVSLEPQVQHLDGHRAQIVVTVDPEIVERAKRTAAKKLAPQLKIPGFRPGKAPYEIIQNYVGEEYLLNEALDDIVNDIYRDALEAASIEPYSIGSVTDVNTDEGLTFTFEVPKRPVVDLGDYRELRVEFDEQEVSDEQVERALQRTREHIGVSSPVDREAALNDMVVLDIHSYFVNEDDEEQDGESAEDETPIAETTSEASADEQGDTEEVTDAETSEASDDHEHDHDDEHDHTQGDPFMHEHGFEFLLLDDPSRDIAPGFSAAIVDAKAGDDVVFQSTFGDDETEEDLRGRTVKFEITVREVREVLLPAVDDFMAQIASDGELETVDALRERLQENLQSEIENHANNAYVNDVVEKLVETASFNYPKEIVDDYIDDIMKELDQYIGEQAGFSLEDYANMTGSSLDDLREQNRERAVERMMNSLVLTAVAEAEGIQVSAEDIDAEIDKQIMQFGGGQVELFRQIFANDEARDRIATQVLSNRTIERIIEIGKGIAPAKGSDEAEDAEPTAEAVSTDADTETVESEEA